VTAPGNQTVFPDGFKFGCAPRYLRLWFGLNLTSHFFHTIRMLACGDLNIYIYMYVRTFAVQHANVHRATELHKQRGKYDRESKEEGAIRKKLS